MPIDTAEVDHAGLAELLKTKPFEPLAYIPLASWIAENTVVALTGR